MIGSAEQGITPPGYHHFQPVFGAHLVPYFVTIALEVNVGTDVPYRCNAVGIEAMSILWHINGPGSVACH